MFAAEHNHTEIVQMLLAHPGIQANIQNLVRTYTMYTVLIPIVTMLLSFANVLHGSTKFPTYM